VRIGTLQGSIGETQGEHESDNGHSADERESRGNRPHCYRQGNNDFDHSNQIGDDLNTEDSVEPEHQRAIRHQGLDALCFASGEFKNTISSSVSTRPQREKWMPLQRGPGLVVQ
jgi:hypothetical protein